MKNVTGVRRNGVLYGWLVCPRINHYFPFAPRYLSLYYTALVLLLQRHVELAAFVIYCHGHYICVHTHARARAFIYKYMDGIIVTNGVRIKFALNTLKWRLIFRSI